VKSLRRIFIRLCAGTAFLSSVICGCTDAEPECGSFPLYRVDESARCYDESVPREGACYVASEPPEKGVVGVCVRDGSDGLYVGKVPAGAEVILPDGWTNSSADAAIRERCADAGEYADPVLGEGVCM
jgi:hypothetical protein